MLTSFQQDNLVVLREAHETRYHLCELNDLRDDRRQFLRRLHPQVLLGLKWKDMELHLIWEQSGNAGRCADVPCFSS